MGKTKKQKAPATPVEKATTKRLKLHKVKATYITDGDTTGTEQINIQITNSNFGPISMLPSIFKYGAGLFSSKGHASDKKAQEFRALCKNLYKELNKQLKPDNWQARKHKSGLRHD